jgi:hypothetical protein
MQKIVYETNGPEQVSTDNRPFLTTSAEAGPMCQTAEGAGLGHSCQNSVNVGIIVQEAM